MPILSVIYGKDQHNAIDITYNILSLFVKNNVLTIPSKLDINSLKYDPYPSEEKRIYITYSIRDKAYTREYGEHRFFDIVINTNNSERDIVNLDNIIIYPHERYLEDDGGLNVLYNFGKILDEMGKNVRMYPTYGFIRNPIFNKYFVDDFDISKSLVIYCEGTHGNPLKACYVVRWLLSELGKNVTMHRGLSFGKNEIVYYFNSELKFKKNPQYVGNVYKCLSLVYLNPLFKNNGETRNGNWCFTNRKSDYHSVIHPVHPENSYEILRYQSHFEHFETFNKYEYFISYDPLTFLSIIASLCGCISIIYPIEGVSKKDWLCMTAMAEYIQEKNIESLYGIAYGMDEIEWAKSTTHLVKEQWDDMLDYYKKKHVTQFLEDIEKIEFGLKNTVENNFYGEDSPFSI